MGAASSSNLSRVIRPWASTSFCGAAAAAAVGIVLLLLLLLLRLLLLEGPLLTSCAVRLRTAAAISSAVAQRNPSAQRLPRAAPKP